MPTPEFPADHLVIDRLEDGGWAVLGTPDGRTFNIPSAWLPEASKEGDTLRLELGGAGEPNPAESQLRFIIDAEASQERRARVKSKLDELRERNA